MDVDNVPDKCEYSYLSYKGVLQECHEQFNCCDCGGNECGCHYCFSCKACEVCLKEE